MSVSNNALTTLEEVKNYMGMLGSKQDDDDLLEALIDRITDVFENFCNVTSFKETTYTEYYDGTGDKYLFLKNIPVISITSIHDDSDWTWGSSTALDSTEYRVMDDKYIIYQGFFSSGDQNIKVVYKAGYSTIPGDLKQAAIEETVRRYKHRKDFDIISKTMEGVTENYADPTTLLNSTKETLRKYKRVGIV